MTTNMGVGGIIYEAIQKFIYINKRENEVVFKILLGHRADWDK